MENIKDLNDVGKPNPQDVKDEWFIYFNELLKVAEYHNEVEEYLDSPDFLNWCDRYNSGLKYRISEYLAQWQNDASRL